MTIDDSATDRRIGGFRVGALNDALAWVSRRKEPLRKYGLAAALLVFAAGLYFAFMETPGLVSSLAWTPLLILVLISAPSGTVLNAVELWALSRIAGGPMNWRASFELTIYTSAANMLPLPGGAITKIAGFRAHGVGYAGGMAMIVLSFLIWGALAFLYSAGALAVLGKVQLGGMFTLAGIALLAASAIGFARYGHWEMVALVALTRLLNFAIEAVRYWLALSAMGIAVTYLQCSVFVVVTFIGSAVVIVPSGLGVSEAAGALVATFVGVTAGAGFVSTAIQRVARLLGLGLTVLVLMAFQRGRQPLIPDRADGP